MDAFINAVVSVMEAIGLILLQTFHILNKFLISTINIEGLNVHYVTTYPPTPPHPFSFIDILPVSTTKH